MSQELIQKISINADLQVAGIKKGISEIESAFAGMKMDKGLANSLSKLKQDLESFAEVSKKEISNMSDAKAFEQAWKKLGNSIDGVEKKLQDIKIDPKKMVGSETINKLNEVKKKIEELNNIRNNKKQEGIIAAENVKEAENAVTSLEEKIKSLKSQKGELGKDFEAAATKVNETEQAVLDLKNQLNEAKKGGNLGELPAKLLQAQQAANAAKSEFNAIGKEYIYFLWLYPRIPSKNNNCQGCFSAYC